MHAMPIPASHPRAVVTGAGSGLGRGFVMELARRSARVLVSDVDAARAEETARLAREHGAETAVLRCDVSNSDDVRALAAEADARFGGVDVVVNNAGVAVSGAIGDVSLEDWRWIVSINLMGVVHGCHEFVPRLKKQGSGHIINVASAAGLVAAPGMGPYNATKFAVVGLSEALYLEAKEAGVGVTVLCPTFFKTNIVHAGRGTNQEGMRAVALDLMEKAKLDADGVARAALEAADAGRLYCLPMADGRAMWAMKRISPSQWYARVGPALMKLAGRRAAR
jgi:NAD(P)-dependent dehydrogenase (short-subunit alcohol dehydrogenase family)